MGFAIHHHESVTGTHVSPLHPERLGHRHIQRKHHLKTQGEDGHQQAKDRGHRRNQPCQHLDLRLPASRIPKKKISVVETTQSVGLAMAALQLIHSHNTTQTGILASPPPCKNFPLPRPTYNSCHSAEGPSAAATWAS